MFSPPANNNHNCLQPRAKARRVPSSGCGVLESGWSPDAQKPPRGVHRRPRGLALSLLFLVDLSLSD
jgi:hypothetical protein